MGLRRLMGLRWLMEFVRLMELRWLSCLIHYKLPKPQ